MTSDLELFRDLDRSQVSEVRIGNGDYIMVKGKGIVAIESCTCTKLISNVMYVPNIDKNLLSVGQLVEKSVLVIFKKKQCLIKYANNDEVFRIKMRNKSFSLDPMEEKQVIGVDLISIYRVFCMYFCNLNTRFTPIFLKISLIPYFLMFCRIRRKIKQSDGETKL